MKLLIELDAEKINVSDLVKTRDGEEIADTQDGYNDAIKEYVESTIRSNMEYDDLGITVKSVEITESQQWDNTPLLG